MLFLLAALPSLFWDGAADTAPALRDAGIAHTFVPAALLASWKGVDGISAETADLQAATKLLPPTVNYRMDVASATSAPWLVANGWKFIRRPNGRFYYDVPGAQAALAAAEAFTYGANAMIRTDAAGLKPLAEMLEFLRKIDAEPMPPVADIGYIDDGSAASGEVMNLLVRNNLLFRVVTSPDPRLKVNVKLGTPEYPIADARNPGAIAHAARYNLTDEKRSVRIYGSQVVVARLTASGDRARLHLLNYAGASRKVEGLRVRMLGRYPNHAPGVELLDYSVEPDATEFTLPELKIYTVIDLSR
jgi:hypothetical protein